MLASAEPFVDEIIVVDTGSRDGTRDVARAFAARLFEFAWCDDFSAARNHSLEQATGDWILWIDADDVLPPESGAELRRHMTECPEKNAAFWATIEEAAPPKPGRPSRVMGHAHVKLFPRHPGIRFQYRVHEQVVAGDPRLGLPIRPTTAVLRHAHADRSPAAERARAERNLRLAYLDLRERPRDPFVWLSWERPTSSCRMACPAPFISCGGASTAFAAAPKRSSTPTSLSARPWARAATGGRKKKLTARP